MGYEVEKVAHQPKVKEFQFPLWDTRILSVLLITAGCDFNSLYGIPYELNPLAYLMWNFNSLYGIHLR